jgi:lysozyme
LGTLQRSTLRQRFNRGDYDGAAEEFLKYTKAGGKVLRGLVNRRNDERALFMAR